MTSNHELQVTRALFVGFLAAGAVAMAASYLVLGRIVVDASAGQANPFLIIAGGTLVATLTAFVIQEVGAVLPGVMAKLGRR